MLSRTRKRQKAEAEKRAMLEAEAEFRRRSAQIRSELLAWTIESLEQCRAGDVTGAIVVHMHVMPNSRIGGMFSPAEIGSTEEEIKLFWLQREVNKVQEWVEECRAGVLTHGYSLWSITRQYGPAFTGLLDVTREEIADFYAREPAWREAARSL